MDASTDTNKPRVVALVRGDAAVPRTFARLVDALRKGGAEVTPLSVPKKPPQAKEPPSGIGLQALKESVAFLLQGGEPATGGAWLDDLLRGQIQEGVDAVVTLDPELADQVFPAVDRVWSTAVRVAVDGDYHVDPKWGAVAFDDLVVPHYALGRKHASVAEGRARARRGGLLVGGEQVEAKTLSGEGHQVVVSVARTDAGDVDPLLFQLSLARPERLKTLFLQSGRSGVDELVRTRAANYGLRAKRPKKGADSEPWIRGATVLMGAPSPEEIAQAVAAGVPVLLFSPKSLLDAGDAFLIQHGVVTHSEQPITIAVQLEGLLPGGADRDAAVKAFEELDAAGGERIAEAVLEAIKEGRHVPGQAQNKRDAASEGAEGDDELEDIGIDAGPPPSAQPTTMPKALRRAYLSEIILHEKETGKQLGRARAGLETWLHRAHLARNARDERLTKEASIRVEGLERIIRRLTAQETELKRLRDRFAGRETLTDADREAASRFMSPEMAATLDRMQTRDAEQFTRLEINDALAELKRRLDNS